MFPTLPPKTLYYKATMKTGPVPFDAALAAGSLASMMVEDTATDVLHGNKQTIPRNSARGIQGQACAMGGKKIFRNPDEEQRPPDRKQCYRPGKETVEAARGRAKQWLEEWNKTK